MKYYIGIDAGTNSVGYATTDSEYRILKYKGNAMWGVRCFESGNTAQERRLHRNERRRRQRKKFRSDCLEMLFNEEIAKKDIAFFQRLKDSAFHKEDKKVEGKYSLFNDEGYNDVDYHKQFPTIYHLRKELIENPNPHDIRLVYLAISHIIKNRGHFLFESYQPMKENGSNFVSIFNEFNHYLEDNHGKQLCCDNPVEITKILLNSSLSSTRKKEQLTQEFHLNKKDHAFEIAVITLLSGNQVTAKQLFQTDEYEDSECKKITFKESYDENSVKYEETFHEKFELIAKIKAIYDWALLAEIMNDEQYISCAKVKQYEKHHEDLCLLKKYVKEYDPTLYDKIFNLNKKDVNNYLNYTGHSKKQPLSKNKCTQEEFCAFLKKELHKADENISDYHTMFDQIENNTFMPKVVSKDNSVIPMQINKAELEAILENAQAYLPFLKNVDENGKSVKEKIIDIFAFRIPYYVGPLNRHSDRSWLERKTDKIYPWNFQQVVDELGSAENFIQNLTSKCTYLHKEDVIPKCSLLYSSFMVLNELNHVRVNGDLLSVEDKQNIYNELFLKKGKGSITTKKIADYFISNGVIDPIITGMDQQFKGTLKSYHDLKNYSLSDMEKEEIIKAITIFGDDKKLLKNRLKDYYGEKLSESDIQRISKLSYKGWSRLSKKLLTGIYSALPESGEYSNMMHALWETQDNLMQLLSKSYKFKEGIDNENNNMPFTSLKEENDSLYVSPKIRRSIYQTLKIIEEIVKIQGCTPAKIFIEMARGEEEKTRTVSRKQKLLSLYKNCKETERELYESLKEKSEDEFQKDKLYLYYTQFGKCMYTNNPISIEDLYNNNMYDIDHIFPRSKVKDDSLDNRVLVLKTANKKKDNDYPICKEWRDQQKDFWRYLLDKNLISKRKYDRLTRNTPLTEDELNDFTNRQLVETRQSTKAIAELLKKRYPDTAIEYIKAALVSDFRYHQKSQEDQFVKCREVNDLHHAKDAYLNIVVGNVYTTKAN